MMTSIHATEKLSCSRNTNTRLRTSLFITVSAWRWTTPDVELVAKQIAPAFRARSGTYPTRSTRSIIHEPAPASLVVGERADSDPGCRQPAAQHSSPGGGAGSPLGSVVSARTE